MSKEKTLEQLQAELAAANEKIAGLEIANKELEATAVELNSALADSELNPASAGTLKIGKVNYEIVVPQFHFGGKLVVTAKDVKGNEDLEKFATEGGILKAATAAEGGEK